MVLTGVTLAVRDARKSAQKSAVRQRTRRIVARKATAKAAGYKYEPTKTRSGRTVYTRREIHGLKPDKKQAYGYVPADPSKLKKYTTYKDPKDMQVAWRKVGTGTKIVYSPGHPDANTKGYRKISTGSQKVQVYWYSGRWNFNRYARVPRPPGSYVGTTPRPIPSPPTNLSGKWPVGHKNYIPKEGRPRDENILYGNSPRPPTKTVTTQTDAFGRPTHGTTNGNRWVRDYARGSAPSLLGGGALSKGSITRVGIVNVSKLPPSEPRTGPSVTIPIGRLPGYEKAKRKAGKGKGKRRRTTKSQPPRNSLYGSNRSGRGGTTMFGPRIRL